jgi:hypothetical protein
VNRCFLTILIIQSISAFGQDAKPDTSFVRSAIQHARSIYAASMQGESGLYSGTDYPEYLSLKPGQHPFFETDHVTKGSILYDGQRYENVGLRYDICRDKVVVEHYYNHSILELVDDKIGGFSIMEHTFIPLSVPGNSPKSGFYDLLYGGSSRVIAKREKVIDKINEGRRIQYGFITASKYFVLHEGVYLPVLSKRSALLVFADKKAEMKQWLGEQKIRFRKSREMAITGMARYYDSLTK